MPFDIEQKYPENEMQKTIVDMRFKPWDEIYYLCPFECEVSQPSEDGKENFVSGTLKVRKAAPGNKEGQNKEAKGEEEDGKENFVSETLKVQKEVPNNKEEQNKEAKGEEEESVLVTSWIFSHQGLEKGLKISIYQTNELPFVASKVHIRAKREAVERAIDRIKDPKIKQSLKNSFDDI